MARPLTREASNGLTPDAPGFGSHRPSDAGFGIMAITKPVSTNAWTGFRGGSGRSWSESKGPADCESVRPRACWSQSFYP